jgi:hypothetical protein
LHIPLLDLWDAVVIVDCGSAKWATCCQCDLAGEACASAWM